jgi:hypothetical protein
MADQVAAPARKKINIAAAFGVPDKRPLAPDKANRIATVIADHIAIKLADHFR